MPWLYLSEFFDNHRDEYIDALFNVSAKNDWARWINLGLLATIETGRKTIERVRKLLEIREEYEEKIRLNDGRDRLMHIVPLLLSKPIISYKNLMETLEVTYPTARADMEALVDMGIVSHLPGIKRPKKYIANDIFRVAYFDD